MRLFVAVIAALMGLLLVRPAAAFCGFYVSGVDGKLVNRATQVVLMRGGTRTVLSMQNAYEGPPQDFAMVVPVPVVLQKEQVKTLPREVLEHVDQLGSPRLVEYWEQDPCKQEGLGMGSGIGQGFGSGSGRLGGEHRTSDHVVKIEAQFAVGEYEVVILSTTDSTALDTWLRENKYRIPEGAEPYLRPYVQAGMKFFVAKVDIEKVQMKDGRAVLSPLRFHYDSETFNLPIRLGLINAGEAQDLVVSILSEKGRYEAANYPNVVIPTNLEVSEQTRTSFPGFYAALFDETLKQKPGSVVTEYAWDAGTCDPCPGPALSTQDVATLGGDVLPETPASAAAASRGGPPSIRMEAASVTGNLPPEVIQRIVRQNFGRFRLCYEKGLQTNPNLQGRVKVHYTIGKDGALAGAASGSASDLPDKAVVACVTSAFSGLSFPQPEGGTVSVTQSIRFLPSGSFRATGVVITRMHMRYSKEALGEDLVFKEAAPILGGREVRGEGGALEQGAVLSSVNNFQGRYAIRHAWTGPVACDKPVRGVWGGPPDGVASGGIQAARDLAFVQRGAGLASFFAGALPPISGPAASGQPVAPPVSAPAASSSPPVASSAAPPAPGAHGGCGCTTAPASGKLDPLFAAGLLGLVALGYRRRGSLRGPRQAGIW